MQKLKNTINSFSQYCQHATFIFFIMFCDHCSRQHLSIMVYLILIEYGIELKNLKLSLHYKLTCFDHIF